MTTLYVETVPISDTDCTGSRSDELVRKTSRAPIPDSHKDLIDGPYWAALTAIMPYGSYTYMAWGDRGQGIYVSPKDRVVIVRNGIWVGGVNSWPDIFQGVGGAVSK